MWSSKLPSTAEIYKNAAITHVAWLRNHSCASLSPMFMTSACEPPLTSFQNAFRVLVARSAFCLFCIAFCPWKLDQLYDTILPCFRFYIVFTFTENSRYVNLPGHVNLLHQVVSLMVWSMFNPMTIGHEGVQDWLLWSFILICIHQYLSLPGVERVDRNPADGARLVHKAGMFHHFSHTSDLWLFLAKSRLWR